MQRSQDQWTHKVIGPLIGTITLVWIAREAGRLVTAGWVIGFPIPILLPLIVTILAFVCTRHRRRRWALFSGLGIAILLAIVPILLAAIPPRINARIAAEDRAALAGDVQPVAPVRLRGIVALKYSRLTSIGAPEVFETRGCDGLCQTLLYSGTAEGVIAMSQAQGGAPVVPMLWRVVHRPGSCDLPYFDRRYPQAWYDFAGGSEAEAQSLIGHCLVGSQAHFGDADFTIQYDAIGKRGDDEWRSLHPAQVGGRTRLWSRERNGRVTLLGRQTFLIRRQLADPLRPVTAGMPEMGWHHYWQRFPLGSGNPGARLGTFVRLDGMEVPQVATADLKAMLDRSPAVGANVDGGTFNRLAMVALDQKRRESGDLQRYLRLLRSPAASGWQVTEAVDAFPENAGLIRQTVLASIAQEGRGRPPRETRELADRLAQASRELAKRSAIR